MSLSSVSSKAVLSNPLVLCILDGWGEREESSNNAIKLATTPNWDMLVKTGFKSQLEASESAVGLPDGQMGNSEVGHLSLGSGRVIFQSLPRINKAISEKTLLENPVLKDLIETLQKNKKACHLMGLFSSGGVHSHMNHLRALIEILNAQGIPLYLHLFLDGRDTAPTSALNDYETFFDGLFEHLSPDSFVHVASIAGRFYGMDRDKRWDRVEKAFKAIAYGEGVRSSSPLEALQLSYGEKITDEFVFPTVIGDYSGIQEGDGLLCFNFRADRVLEIMEALVVPDFHFFDRKSDPCFSKVVGMTKYSDHLMHWMEALFLPEKLDDVLGEVISRGGLTQLHLAETEKYAHVTFFFNGGREAPFLGEDRILIPSPKVSTYDLKPEMSAFEITETLLDALLKKQYDVYIVNFANADMVGHTGNLKASIQAVEVLDDCLGKILKGVQETESILLITADHGNIEKMENEIANEPDTSHTCFPVPCILINVPTDKRVQGLKNGILADVAPTVLDLIGLSIPDKMTGHSLLIAKGR
ncbi:MAG: phosphoglycerate mutase (2,3-diphosphoglycerate-independent) [Alphaproteobacteria bacterium 16-39-46]|nr:MAG: phosphoglycerate mutase (2,3-diphosphoglycerate-independent) [Alphaproteobacteria bacterium 16-39-46]OZA43627.1 MAG: phosphoglycerate mutase (2,3-diphosphoglycerate-independent) [Alphaproteobacteria bacterium 17-39-52]HQS83787.1 2,3-bisphosphoglycerate-independent phosphoglycerate mutase [Alphaproteobacteria bacterium]HQS93610.1 2,3-bisphosphoglycerate-independent phosphoglycerate mutase [Alphaproteobacteria bacterium]